jgi:hypothetical protein
VTSALASAATASLPRLRPSSYPSVNGTGR